MNRARRSSRPVHRGFAERLSRLEVYRFAQLAEAAQGAIKIRDTLDFTHVEFVEADQSGVAEQRLTEASILPYSWMPAFNLAKKA
ncbi:hypothetical protein [Nocardia aurantiaca]|uniref:hypothetical protein n=1 Tax=Nocardia aurantiaca TaxID=2675850 RepID=UPI002E22948F